jgi:two-component system NtrC family sensor kinase
MNDDAPQLNWSTTHWGASEPALPCLDPMFTRLLLENIPTRVVVFDRDRCYLYANREALRVLGLPADQVIGKHISEVLEADLVNRLLPVLDRLFAGEALHQRGWVEFGRQGRRYREHEFVPYSPGGGPVTAVVVCGLDRTEQRLGEQQLERHRAALRASEVVKSAIVDNALAAIISTDGVGRIVEFNPSAQAMFGLTRDEVLGQPIGRAMQGVPLLDSSGGSLPLGRRFETRVMRPDGTAFPAEVVLWRADAEDTTLCTISIVDISERHRAAQQIERQREALRQSEKLTTMGSLLAGVSHELNNPLSVVLGRARLLAEKCEGDPGRQQDALRIRDAAERCGRIVRTFLNMARSKPPRRSPVSLNDAVHSAADMLGYSLRSHDVSMETAARCGPARDQRRRRPALPGRAEPARQRAAGPDAGSTGHAG